jgi:hypothetical protein
MTGSPPARSRRLARRHATLAVAALAATLLATVQAAAQDRSWPPQYRRDRAQFALETAGSLAQLRGDALGSATDGAGFDVLASVGVSVLSLGGGYQRATHRVAGQDAVVDGFFFEPRVALPFAARNFTPFVFGRAARLERTFRGAGGASLARGTGLGAGVGTYVWLAPNIQLNTSLGWHAQRFGDDGAAAGAPLAGQRSGEQWTVRAGLTLGFDRWGR